jgi:hypothetical protein
MPNSPRKQRYIDSDERLKTDLNSNQSEIKETPNEESNLSLKLKPELLFSKQAMTSNGDL